MSPTPRNGAITHAITREIGANRIGVNKMMPTSRNMAKPIAMSLGSQPIMHAANRIPLTDDINAPATSDFRETPSMSDRTTWVMPSNGVRRAARRAGTATPTNDTTSPHVAASTNGHTLT